jgi:hypothetical protein
MSNDLRSLLHDAAIAPSTDADVSGAWRRGHRMRFQRRAVSVLAIAAIVGLGSLAIANVVPNDHNTAPIASVSTPTTPAPRCAAPSTADDIPSWAAAARVPPTTPHLVSADGNVLAVLFGYPLRAGTPTDRQNKILWVVRQPRGSQPLVITASMPGARSVHVALPANSGPGEIYPSIMDAPEAGCWRFALAWNGHRSVLALAYRFAETPSPTTTTATATTTTTTASTPSTSTPSGTTCRTANLSVSLGQPIGSAGHLNYEITFRNNGASSCVMTGFPGVSFLDGTGSQTGSPAARNRLSYVPVDIAPGATAYAHLSVNDLGNPPCSAAARYIRVYPPNETHSFLITLRTAIQMCGVAYIDPVLDHPIG